MSRAAVVDVTVDDDLNIFTLALLGGRPHVMSCSLLTHGKRKVTFNYTHHQILNVLYFVIHDRLGFKAISFTKGKHSNNH